MYLTRSYAIPTRPIWPGLIANTIFYAVILWLLICGPFSLRRLIRMKRGQCLKCGYLIGEAALCSECGEALPARLASRRVITTS